jgi:hypothetical protein
MALVLLSWGAPNASAQTLTVGDPIEDYLRILQISGMAELGSFTIRPLPPGDFRERLGLAAHPWRDRLGTPASSEGDLAVLVDDPRLRTFVNSRFPLGQNDGVVWQGKGLTTALDAGASVTWRALTVSVRPTLLYTQNSSFELAPAPTEYDYPWRPIDLPQRFGPDPLWTLDPGQSEIRLDTHGVSVGFGTTNLWWGPAIRNPIIMSNNAPGLPHAFLGTNGPISIGIGRLEAQWIWGDLDQSDWFGYSSPNDDRFMTGVVATYMPSFLPGLSLGATRIFYVSVPEDGTPLGDYFAVFQGVRKKALVTPENPTGDDEHDQMLSLFGRWVLPESGFEVFWEWARNDHSWELRDFLLEPEHSQAYMLGLQKAISLSGDRIVALRTELTHLAKEPTYIIRGASPTYYAHHIVTQGYTQDGQAIGAGIGPAGNALGVGADLYAPWGRAGLMVQRDVRDQDAYFDWALANDMGSCCHNVLYHFGADGLWFKGDFDLGAGMIVTREFNRYFFGLDVWNLNLSLSARWHPS